MNDDTKAWNRCDVCGKFIPYADFDSGAAIRYMVTPDSDFTAETWDTVCKVHAPDLRRLYAECARARARAISRLRP